MLFGICANGHVYARKQVNSSEGYGLGEFYDATQEMNDVFKQLQQDGTISALTRNLRPKNCEARNLLTPAKSAIGQLELIIQTFCLETQGASYDDGVFVLMCPVDEKLKLRALGNWVRDVLTGVPSFTRQHFRGDLVPYEGLSV